MRQDTRSAESLHLEYRRRADNATQVFSGLKTDFPHGSFPIHAARVWRFALLAEVWGVIATKLCNGKTDYIQKWRSGK